jgi:threonine aldolase
VERLAEDHRRAKELANVLAKTSWVSSVEPVETNILIFHWQLTAVISVLIEKLKQRIFLSARWVMVS